LALELWVLYLLVQGRLQEGRLPELMQGRLQERAQAQVQVPERAQAQVQVPE
jgi:hypothetical protein